MFLWYETPLLFAKQKSFYLIMKIGYIYNWIANKKLENTTQSIQYSKLDSDIFMELYEEQLIYKWSNTRCCDINDVNTNKSYFFDSS